MFPAALNEDSPLHSKEYVFGIRGLASSKAWPLRVFSKTPVINDKVGTQSLVLIGDVYSRTVRAYERKPDETFEQTDNNSLSTGDSTWTSSEGFLTSDDGKQKRARLPGHISYWFAWDNFLGLQSELYLPE